jgi:hypothetical protein
VAVFVGELDRAMVCDLYMRPQLVHWSKLTAAVRKSLSVENGEARPVFVLDHADVVLRRH